MSRNKKPLPLLQNITITGLAAEGNAIAKVNDVVVFVPHVIPGDVVDLQVTKKKSHFMEARAVRFEKYSDDRIEPVCEHFGVCGGCKWQILPYNLQLQSKEQQTVEQLVRIGKLELPEVSPILGGKKTEFYRNKLEFTFSNKRWRTYEEMKEGKEFDTMNAVGFHIPGQFDKVLDINKCWLQNDISNELRNEIRKYALENNLTFFDLRMQEGFLRTMMVRTTSTGELMLIVVFFYEEKDLREALLKHIADKFPQITSLLYVINSKANDTITDREVFVFKGSDCIYEEMEGLKFKIGPKSFFQTNSEQAYELYKVARNFAELTGKETVYDLYTGTGTIALFVAGKCKEVIGIEYVPEAIEDAKVNAELNGITNTKFFAGDMKDIFTEEFFTEHGKADVIITDPPRTGMHTDVIEAILKASPKKIVYVSCNPATQARDVNLLSAEYKITKFQPVDMFPHTHHIENVLLLEKRN